MISARQWLRPVAERRNLPLLARVRRPLCAQVLRRWLHADRILPDRRIPPDWWDHYIFKADTRPSSPKDRGPCGGTREDRHEHQQLREDRRGSGVCRGATPMTAILRRPGSRPNPSLGPIQTAPFYAVPINLGDLGTKWAQSGMPVPASYVRRAADSQPVCRRQCIRQSVR